jgi:hypothetical protein
MTMTTKEARSGETGGHVRIILIAELALAIIGMIVVPAIWSQG